MREMLYLKKGRKTSNLPLLEFVKGVIEIARKGPWTAEQLEKIFSPTEKKVIPEAHGESIYLINAKSKNNIHILNRQGIVTYLTVYPKKSKELTLDKLVLLLNCNYRLIHISKPEGRVRFSFDYRKGAITHVSFDYYYYEDPSFMIEEKEGQLMMNSQVINEADIVADEIIIDFVLHHQG